MKHRVNLILFLGLSVLIWLFFHNSEWLISLLILICLLYLSILGFGVMSLRFQYFMKSITRLNNHEVLLTFDDGPNFIHTPRILDTLKKHNVKGVFFLVGNRAFEHPDLVRRIISEGHLVGNHTFSHFPFFALCNSAIVGNEIDSASSTIKKITENEVVFFRPPIGYSNPIISRAVRKRNLKVMGWSKRSFDTVFRNQQLLLNRLLKITKSGDIVLMHDNLAQTQQVLDTFLCQAKNKGIIFASNITEDTITK
jgi:peptidoglycan/xylan/chitin deacetylase (PgdA/CDA1 family)